MADLTERAGIPYPEGQDPHDVPADMGRIAERAAGLLGAPLVTVQERNALDPPDLYPGRVVYNTTSRTFDVYDGNTWRVQASHADLGGVAADLAAHEDSGNPHTGSASPGDVSTAVGRHEGRADPHHTYVDVDGTRLPGWVPLYAGSFDGTTPVWDIPSGEFHMIRIHLHGFRSTGSSVWLRINNVSTSGSHLSGYTITDMATGDVVDAGSSTSVNGFVIHRTPDPADTATVTLYNTHINGIVSFESEATRKADHHVTQAVGRTSQNMLVQSLRLIVSPVFGAADFVVEGFRP